MFEKKWYTYVIKAKKAKVNDLRDMLLLERYKKAKIRKRRNQKKIPTPKTEVGKNQTNNQVLIP